VNCHAGLDPQRQHLEHGLAPFPRIGEAAAKQLKHVERLASIVPADQITRTSEKVAVKQGLQLRVFTSMTEAIRWLLEPPLRPPSLG
jgi:hypothetical protein